MQAVLVNSLVAIFSSGILIALLVGLLIFLRAFIDINNEVFRKLMHFSAFLLVPFVALFSNTAWAALISFLFFALASYVGLYFFSKWNKYSEFFVERRPGEIRTSFLLFCIQYALLFLVLWGIFEKEYIVVVAACIWVFSDLAAALIGKAFGKHKFLDLPVNSKAGRLFHRADKNKTLEGSIAFLLVAFLVGMITLAAFGPHYSSWIIAIEALIAGVIGAYVELISKKGIDTITIPASLSVFMLIFNLIGDLIIKLS